MQVPGFIAGFAQRKSLRGVRMTMQEILGASDSFMPHGHCYLWIPSILWMHVVSDLLIGAAYVGISFVLYTFVRRTRLPFSPVFIAFGLFIGLCGLTHFMGVWTVWHPDYILDGVVKAATALASVATAVGLLYVRPQVIEVVHAARLSEERRIRLETMHAELNTLYLKVRDLDQAKTRFFANVSHELRTPLSLIVGPVERLLEDETLGAGQRRQLESVRRNGQALLKQVNDLLDVAKLEAGKMEIHYARVDMAGLVRRIAGQFEVPAEQRGLVLDVSAPQTLEAECDPQQIEQIIVNLLSNAVKFTPAGGRVHLRLAEDGGDVVLEVSDTGPGIAAGQQGAIFERFQRAPDTGPGGTGLGLAIVKDLAELHGGSVALVSAPGQGAAFTVRVPRRAPGGAHVAAAAAGDGAAVAPAVVAAYDREQDLNPYQPHQPGRVTVLIVEDNAELRGFVAEALATSYNVATAADGREGLARALALRPDLVVTDLMMPHMGGDQLVRALRSDSALDTMPILLLSARADDALRVALLRVGAQDYLVKPFLPQELAARVANLIAMKHAGDVLRTELAASTGSVQALAAELAAKHRQLRLAFDAAEVAREHAERASRVKSQFLALISHELRTPLSTIQLNAQLLAGAPPAAMAPDKVSALASRLLRAARQMGALVEGVLEYARAESGRIVARNEETDLSALVDDVLASHRELVPAGVVLQRDAPPAGPERVRTDPRLLSVVLNNLLSNAIKFTQRGTVSVGLHRDGRHIRITVADTGIGIAADNFARIFEPFEQLEPLRRKSIQGSGVGLALAKQLVEALGGRIDVRSTPGEGSVFAVILPIAGEHDNLRKNDEHEMRDNSDR